MMDESFDISRFGRDLTAEARAGRLHPIIGREDILARIVEVLGRATKNNPILVGEPGVGKTAIVEGVAQVLVSDKCPSWLKGKKLLSLEFADLIAGTRARGDFEARLKQLRDFLHEFRGKILIFFDEIHQLVSFGGGDGSIDAANFFKPMLARGEIHCIGATTFDEYRKIERDAALARRFLVVRVDEPSDEETLSILRGLRERFEAHHGIRIQEDALAASLDLTNRYVSERKQPDKAIDVLDEACAYLRAVVELPPALIQELETMVNQLRIKEGALRREGGDELARTRSELRRTEKELTSSVARWRIQADSQRRYSELLSQRDLCIEEIDQAERALDLRRVVSLKIDRLKAITSQLEGMNESVAGYVLDARMVAQVVARMTRIKSAGVVADARARLAALEKALISKWPDQANAVEKIRGGLARAYTGLSSEHRPLLSAVLRVAKDELVTEFARSVAVELCDGSFVSADMREYSDKSSVTKLIGAPPGYIGHESSVPVLERVRQRPYCVVLFRNVENADEEIARLVSSVLTEGELSDSSGRAVTFRHAIVFVSTSQGEMPGSWDGDLEIEMRSAGNDDLRSAAAFWLRELEKKLLDRAVVNVRPAAIDALIHNGVEGLASLKSRFRDQIEIPIANLLIEKPSVRFVIGVREGREDEIEVVAV